MLLAVEIMSSDSVNADRIDKPAEYAMAGIPHYWRIEQAETGLITYTYRLDPAGVGGNCMGNKKVINVITAGTVSDIDPPALVGRTFAKVVGVLRPVNIGTFNVASPIDKTSVEILQNPDAVFRFDGSDLMPGAVGAGSFWKEMTAWIGEDQSTKDTLDNIEASWP